MDDIFFGAGTALWLGILTSISPCPLATNIAAISFIGKRVDNPRIVLLSGLFYTLGRMAAYIAVGMIVVIGILSIPGMSYFLQNYMNRVLGPILIIVGLILLEVIKVVFFNAPDSGGRLQSMVERSGIWGAGLIGIVFALSFCPVSAALFFGSLIPLSVGVGSSIIYPSIYGIGTGLPVIVFATLVAFGTGAIGKIFNRLSQFERWARRVTAVIFIVVGIYFFIFYTLGIF